MKRHHCGKITTKTKKCPRVKRRFTVSVSADAHRLFKAAAEARGWSVRQLVEEARR
jgi:predicted HicB family RNase H-like nuclease